MKNWQTLQDEMIKKLTPTQAKWFKEGKGKKVVVLKERFKDLNIEKIREYFKDEKEKGINDSLLVTSLIWQSFVLIEARVIDPMNGNMRSFWYRELRPFLVKNGLLGNDEIPGINTIDIESPIEIYDEGLSKGAGREIYILNLMSRKFDDYVLEGFFKFKGAFKFTDPRKYYRIIGKNKPRYIFFTEKEGLWELCKEIAKEYGISAVAAHGEPGLLTTEYLADELKARDVKNVKIGALTDYDPWGYNIADSFGEKLGSEVFNLVIEKNSKLTSLDLFTEETIEYKKRDLTTVNPKKKKQVDDWMKITHGINDEPYGMHVDNAEIKRVKKRVEEWLAGTYRKVKPGYLKKKI